MIAALAMMLFIAPVYAQSSDEPQVDETQLYDHALAAGYKAAFICSALWNGDKQLEAIERDELLGIYPRIAEIAAKLTAEIDEEDRQVRVVYHQDSPP